VNSAGREVRTGRKGVKTSVLPVITLLTDFGGADYFVGAVKGAILTRTLGAVLVDITHDIPAHDVEAGAFTLLASYDSFPHGSIHLAVVDPGVGSSRRAIIVRTNNQFFVGPDNGLFSYIYDREENWQVFQITNRKYFSESVSPTFHGRDIFAPIAAALSTSVAPKTLGVEIDDPVRLPSLKPIRRRNGEVVARVLHVDRFGNCITNITRESLSVTDESRARLVVKKRTISRFKQHFAEGELSQTGPFAIWGSAGFLEISVRNKSAAALLKVGRGEPVRLIVKSSGQKG
jgi:S-adenosyl-L-methionine hydrolase (adenosine-forming)